MLDFTKTDEILEKLLSQNCDYQNLVELCSDLSKKIPNAHESAAGRKYPSALTQCILECYKIKNKFSSHIWYSKKDCEKEKMTPITEPIKFSRTGAGGEIYDYELYNSEQVTEINENKTEIDNEFFQKLSYMQKVILNFISEFSGLYGRSGVVKILKGSKAIKDNSFNEKALKSRYFGRLDENKLTDISEEIDNLLNKKVLIIKKGMYGRPLLDIVKNYSIPAVDEKEKFLPKKVYDENENIQKILDLIYQGKNIFITGHAGTGKSYILNRLKEKIPTLVVTSTTGIAAVNVKGQTIHSWAGVGICNRPVEQTVDRILKKSTLKKNIQKSSLLALDEVSMLDIKTFEYVDAVLKKVRENTAPFGGIQVIFIGDFFQLPPVTKTEIREKYCFNSPLWEEFGFETVKLTENHRQKEENFINALAHMRVNALTKEDINLLRTREVYGEIDVSDILHIFATNGEADGYNTYKLNSIDSQIYNLYAYDGIYKGKKLFDTPTNERETNMFNRIDAVCNAEKNITLKQDVRVMLLTNLDFERGLINGSCGTVLEIEEDYVLVIFDNGVTEKIQRHDFEFYNNEVLVAVRKQFPLRLAYGITIHKSQGMSLDKLVVDCSRIFEKGQAYVALSRIKTLEGLYLRNFSSQKVMVDEEVVKFYEWL